MSDSNGKTVIISDEWIQGAIEAARVAHDNYADTSKDDIFDATVARKVREFAEIGEVL